MKTERDDLVRTNDPYCSFEDDHERKDALVSLHRRDIAIARIGFYQSVALGALGLFGRTVVIIGLALL